MTFGLQVLDVEGPPFTALESTFTTDINAKVWRTFWTLGCNTKPHSRFRRISARQGLLQIPTPRQEESVVAAASVSEALDRVASAAAQLALA